MILDDPIPPEKAPTPSSPATLTFDLLESRILLSATWTDGDTGDVLSGSTVFNDVFHGSTGNDTAYGLAGDDVLFGDLGNDRLYGGDGDDQLFGGAGNDRLHGENGNDLLDGGDGNDLLDGGAGDDVLLGGAGNDTLYGRDGADRLEGGEGDDRLYGGNDDDQLSGGAGNDRLYGENGNDLVEGGDGNDLLDGGAGDDVLLGGAGNDTLYGRDGADRLEGGEGDDRLYGGNDDDQLSGGAGNDRLYGENGNDLVDGGDGNDLLDGGAGDDVLLGGAGNDTLYGRDGADRLEGGEGDDRLYGGNDDDQLSGGAGNDRLYGENGNDLVDGGDGNDLLDGGAGDDVLLGGAGNDTLYGRDGADRLEGGEGDDRLYGGNDDDQLSGGAGNDRLYGENGNDLLDGGDGDDLLYGGAGDDVIHTGAGNNRVWGGAGNDIIYSGSGDNVIDAGAGNDIIHSFGGSDSIQLGSGADVVVIHAGQDGDVVTIRGGGADDVLDLSAFYTDQVTVEGALVTVRLDDGGSFVIHARGITDVVTTEPPPLYVHAGTDLDVPEGSTVALEATATSVVPLNFSDMQVLSYGGAQDVSGVASAEAEGTVLHISGNGWKKIEFPYDVTPDTILEFDFRSDAPGEIHGIGFDTDDNLSENTIFKLFGTQTWGIRSYDNYDTADEWTHYRIRVGDHFQGRFEHLVFANDHDVASPTAESLFRNLQVYESDAAANEAYSFQWVQLSGPAVTLSGASTAAPTFITPSVDQDTELVFQVVVTDGHTASMDTVTVRIDNTPDPLWIIDTGPDLEVPEAEPLVLEAVFASVLRFDETDIRTYAGPQDIDLEVRIEDDGTSLYLEGNGWKRMVLPYGVTPDTVLEFDFRSTVEGEIHGIGLDSDNDISPTTTFQLHGTQAWGRSEYNDYEAAAGEWQHYRIPVGEHFTGDFDYLIFVNDHDVAHPDGNSGFRNIRLYEYDSRVGGELPPRIQWAQIGGPAVELLGKETLAPTFVSPQVSTDTDLVFQVTVGSGRQAVTDVVRVTVRDTIPAEPDEPPAGDPPGSGTDDLPRAEADAQSVDLAELAERELLRDVDWTSEALEELHPHGDDFGAGDPWRTLEHVEAMVHRELDDGGSPLVQGPLLRETIDLGFVRGAPELDVAWPDAPTLVPVGQQSELRGWTPVEVRLPVYGAWGDAATEASETLETAAGPSAAAGVIAAMWGLLRGLAGARFRGPEDEK
jgi:Ca2+-binding RTX toxin-like protein